MRAVIARFFNWLLGTFPFQSLERRLQARTDEGIERAMGEFKRSGLDPALARIAADMQLHVERLQSVLEAKVVNETWAVHHHELRLRRARLLYPAFRELVESIIADPNDSLFLKHGSFLFDTWIEEQAKVGNSYAWIAAHFSRLSSKLSAPRSAKASPRLPAGRLRILFVTGIFPSQLHAGGLRILDLMRELRSHGHEVHLYSVFRGGTDARARESLAQEVDGLGTAPSEDFGPERLSRWLQAEGRRYDVIHFEYPNVIPLIPAVAPYGALRIYTMMECDTRRAALALLKATQDWPSPAACSHLVSDFFGAVEREHFAATQVELFIGLTPKDCAQAQRLGAAATRLVPTGISPGFLARGATAAMPEARKDTIVFVANYDHLPNREGLAWYLERVHPLVAAGWPHAVLRVVGAGNPGEELRADLRFPGVVFVGAVDNVADEILSSTLCIAPLISGAGFRGKVNQYAALGRAAVSTSIGNCGLPYKDGESVLIADEPAAFAGAVLALLGDEGRRARIGQAAREICARHFSWNAIVRNMVQEVYGTGA